LLCKRVFAIFWLYLWLIQNFWCWFLFLHLSNENISIFINYFSFALGLYSFRSFKRTIRFSLSILIIVSLLGHRLSITRLIIIRIICIGFIRRATIVLRLLWFNRRLRGNIARGNLLLASDRFLMFFFDGSTSWR
jgi:hypothetical protein